MQRDARQSGYHIGLVMEQAMGHVTHHRALMMHAARDRSVRATCMEVPYHADDTWSRIPGVSSNLSLLLSLRARAAIRERQRVEGKFDALLFHTQVTALLSQGLMRKIPCVLSLDATPLNTDPTKPAKSSRFMRRPDPEAPWELAKRHLVRRAFNRAARLIAWSDWARLSLEQDYGVDAGKIAVVPPGVDTTLWQPRREAAPSSPLPRLLFVGADFERKGGDILLEAFRQEFAGRARLDIVTPDPGAVEEGADVRVHRGLSINSPELRALYRDADIFVLPTLNDCTPLAVLEAMASGLPVITSDVGAIREMVESNVTGMLLRPGDPAELARAMRVLIADPARRRAMGLAGRARAERRFDAQTNYEMVFSLLKSCVNAWRGNESVGRVNDGEPSAQRRDAAPVDDMDQAWASQH